jgi:hypothetical protein
MFKKQCVIVALISINAATFAMNEEPSRPIPQGTNINSNDTTVNTQQVFMQSTGQNTYHTHQQPTFIPQKMSDNPLFNAAGIVAKAAAEGAVQGVFQGVGQGVGQVLGGIVAQQLTSMLNSEERNALQILSENQKIENLSELRDRVNNYNIHASDDEELTKIAYALRIEYAQALLTFIKRQKSEEICMITPLLHKVQEEVNAFAADTKGTEDQSLINLRKQIQQNYGLLLHKQLQYEKESSKPIIVIPAREMRKTR